MTSAEFAAKYRVLKTISESGARSQIAQEIGLGRMVMVHHLDVGTPAARERLLAQARSLSPDASARVFALTDVEGTPVIITHFLASFIDLPTWLTQHAGVDPDATQIIEVPAVPLKKATPVQPPAGAVPPSPPSAAPREASFTSIFGAPSTPNVSPAAAPRTPPPAVVPPPSAPAAPSPPPQGPSEFTRVFQGLSSSTPPASSAPPPPPAATPRAPSRPEPIAQPPAPPAASFAPPPIAPAPIPPQPTAPQAAPSGSGGGFTSVFGNLAPPPRAQSSMPSLPPQAPPMVPQARPVFDSVMRPVDPAPPPPAAAPPSSPAPPAGAFTDLFKRLEVPPGAPAPLPPRPFVPPPIASGPPLPPVAPPVAPAAIPTMPSAGAPVAGAPSEFTRVLGRMSPPPAPHFPQAPAAHPPTPPLGGMAIPGAPTPKIAPAVVEEQVKKSYLPLIIALNVLVLLAIGVVLLFVLHH